jgi:spore coat protein CotH
MFFVLKKILWLLALGMMIFTSGVTGQAQIVLAEFMAKNVSVLKDEDGQYSDWIEVYNNSTNPVNLANWALTDIAGNLTKWLFPATNLGPRQFLVVFASNKDRRVPGAPLHTNFKLDDVGEYLALVAPDGTNIATEFAPTYPPQIADVSYGLSLDANFVKYITTNTTGRLLVPANGTLGTNWTLPDFNHSSWTLFTNRVGFDYTGWDRFHDLYRNTIWDGSPPYYWTLDDSQGSGVAMNQGTLAGFGDATISAAVTQDQAGPRPANFAGFDAYNNGFYFNGTSAYLDAGSSLLNNRSAFAMAGWIYLTNLPAANSGLWGQNDVVEFGFVATNQLSLWTPNGGSVAVTVPASGFLNTWHYVAAVGDGATVKIYYDGLLLGSAGVTCTNYGTSSYTVKIGGGGIFAASGNFLKGYLDEVALYHRALSDEEVQRHYQCARRPAFSPAINLTQFPNVVAKQSSTYSTYGANRAIDGNTDGVVANGSVSHTQGTNNNEWWEVDLTAQKQIDRVHLWFRTDGALAARDENISIYIYDSTNVATRQILWASDVGTLPGSNRGFDVSPPVNGRVVRVEHPDGITNFLQLAEVQVLQAQPQQWPAITTDLAETMHNVNPSVYLRFPFVINNPSQVSRVLLRMKSDDGFVAWVNGTKFASRRAPENPQWNSSAASANPARCLETMETFELLGANTALRTGTNILAIQGLNIATNNSDLYLFPEVEISYVGSIGTPRFFGLPTPGIPNGYGTTDLGPIISNPGHFPKVPLDHQDINVTATVTRTFAPINKVTLVYQVMYGVTNLLTLYDDGLHGDGLTNDNVFGAVIPAAAFTNGQMVRWYMTSQDVSNRVSRWPLFEDPLDSPEFLGTVVGDTNLTSQLPVFHLFVSPANLPEIDKETGGRASFFYDGEFYDNIYMEVRGNSSAGYNKKSHRLEFNRSYTFRPPGSGGRMRKTSLLAEYVDPTYLRQHLSFWFMEMIGVGGPFCYPVRVQMNSQFYQLAQHSEVMGSDLLSRVGYSTEGALYKAAGNINPTFNSTATFTKVLPNDDTNRNDFVQLARGIADYVPAGQRMTNVFDMLDLPNIVNYMTAARFCSENDDVWANMTLYRDTYGDGLWRIIPYDMNASWGQLYAGGTILQATNDDSKSHPLCGNSSINPGGGPQGTNYWNRMYDVIQRTPETREMLLRRYRTVMDRFVQLPETPLPNRIIENHIIQMTNLIWPEAALDRQKWGASPWCATKGITNGTDDLLNQFVGPRRYHWYVTHCLTNTARPLGLSSNENAGIPLSQPTNALVEIVGIEYNPASSNQAQEYVCLTNPNSYAVDISGWKIAGAVSFSFKEGTVIPANHPLYVSPDVVAFRSRLMEPRGGQGLFVVGPYSGQLSAWGETVSLTTDSGRLVTSYTYPGSPSPAQRYLRLTEFMYHPEPLLGNTNPADAFEFIELKNISTNVTLDLVGVHFTNGVDFTFTGSAVTQLAPQQRVLVVRDVAAFTARYGSGLRIAGTFSNALDNAGETIRLDDAMGEKILEFNYQDGWYPLADGLGFSLVIRDENALWNTWDLGASWRASAVVSGQPGLNKTLPTLPAPVLINEILSHSVLPAVDLIELYNPNTNAVDISGWYLTDDWSVPKKYRFPSGSIITGRTYQTVSELLFNTGALPFAFGSDGDSAWLFSADGATNLTGYYHGFKFAAADPDVSFGRYVNSIGEEHFVAMTTNTFGTNNAPPKVGPVVINEIMYHPPDALVNGVLVDNDWDEFIELLNLTTNAVPLFDPAYPTNTWKLSSAVDFIFPTNCTLGAGSNLLVVNFDPLTNSTQLAAFRAKYSVPAGTPLFGPYGGHLANDQETVKLSKPVMLLSGVAYVIVDQVNYLGFAPWPVTADGQGFSLARLVPSAYGNDPTHWTASVPTPGTLALLEPVQIIQGPVSQSAVVNGEVCWSALYEGKGLWFTNQWQRNGTNLWVEVTTNTWSFLRLTNLQFANQGAYSLTVWNENNPSASTNFSLTILPDTAGNGIPDTWKILHGFPTNLWVTATQDADNDGMSNLAEYLAGTDPTNATSRFAAESAATEGRTLRFLAMAYHTYTVQYTDNLVSGGWLRLTEVVACPTNRVEVIDDKHSVTNRYYRVVTPRIP